MSILARERLRLGFRERLKRMERARALTAEGDGAAERARRAETAV